MRKKSIIIIAVILILAAIFIFFALLRAGGDTSDRSAPGTQRTELKVPLQILNAPGGATMALVPVTIQGEGPFLFGLDTGASKTVIDDNIVERLDLTELGDAGVVIGVTGRTRARLVQVSEWRIDHVAIPAAEVVSIDLIEPNQPGPVGLLGSDILSEYGAITVDYENATLLLQEKP